MSGYYIGTNAAVDDISWAPTLHARYAWSPRLAVRSSVAYQRRQVDRDESGPGQRFVKHKVIHSTLVPLLLEVTLNPAAPKFHVGLLGGLTLRYSDINDQETYFYSGTTNTSAQNRVEKRLDTFLGGGLSLRYQATPRWAVVADGTLGARLGGKTQYYEWLPSATLLVGVGYGLGK
jgi:hypothetical protein